MKIHKETMDFIEWMGKYHLKQKRDLNGGRYWYSGSKYWRFNSIQEMYGFYCEHYFK